MMQNRFVRHINFSCNANMSLIRELKNIQCLKSKHSFKVPRLFQPKNQTQFRRTAEVNVWLSPGNVVARRRRQQGFFFATFAKLSFSQTYNSQRHPHHLTFIAKLSYNMVKGKKKTFFVKKVEMRGC